MNNLTNNMKQLLSLILFSILGFLSKFIRVTNTLCKRKFHHNDTSKIRHSMLFP